MRSKIIKDFHKLWRNEFLNDKVTFLGNKICKSPMDLWIYQEILYDIKPDVVIECGTYMGGTAYYIASLMDIMNKGEVITMDIKQRKHPKHDRISYFDCMSTDADLIYTLNNRVKNKDAVLVILDSDHRKKNVLRELNIYSKFVTKGSYIIVEDSDLNGHPTVYPQWRIGVQGPYEAAKEFLKSNKEFEIDKSREKFLIGVVKSGFLKRIR